MISGPKSSLDDAQQPTRSIGIVNDVTAQHESRETIEDTLGRYRALVNSLATMEWRATADGVPIYSQGWTALTGQLEIHVAHGAWLDVIHPADRQRVATSLGTVRQDLVALHDQSSPAPRDGGNMIGFTPARCRSSRRVDARTNGWASSCCMTISIRYSLLPMMMRLN